MKKKQPMWLAIIALLVFLKYISDNKQQDAAAADRRVDAAIRHAQVQSDIATCRAGGVCK